MSNILFSKRGARLRIVDGFKFRLYRTLANGMERWVCINKNCNAFMKLNNGRVEESSFEHNHEADSERQLMGQVMLANAELLKTYLSVRGKLCARRCLLMR